VNRLNIAARIWLSIGIFILGFLISMGLQQVQGIETEKTLASRIGIHVTAPSFGDTHQKILRYASRGRP